MKWLLLKIPTQESDYSFYLDKRDKDGRRFINPDGCTFYLSPAGPAEVEKITDELIIQKIYLHIWCTSFSAKKV